MICAIDPGSHLAIAYVKKPVPLSTLSNHLHTKEWAIGVPEKAPPAIIYEAELRMCRLATAFILKKAYRSSSLHLLIEDFSPRMMNKSRAFLSPVRTTIAILTLLRADGLRFTYDLPPSSTMANMTDERLRALNLWIPGSRDRRAAVKHLAVYLRKPPST